MSRNRFKSIITYTIAGIGVLLVCVLLLLAVEQRRTQAETGAVLSGFFSQKVLHDTDHWSGGRAVEIVILRNPGCPMCSVDGNGPDRLSWFAPSWKWRRSALSDAWFAQSSPITRASFFFTSVYAEDVSVELHLPGGARADFVNWTDVSDKADEFETRFPNNLGFFAVSRVGLNLHRTEALVYVEHFCGGLCGGGDYVLLRKVDGTWHVVGDHNSWVS